MIQNVQELAEHVGATHPTKESIARNLYKYTRCGISFWTDEKDVVVSGYCEGTDRECFPHRLSFPFEAADFDKAVEQADQDGCDLWDETHGCEDCNTSEIDGDKPIDPDCPSCEGGGMIL